MSDSTMPAGWYQDPTRIGEGRYWDGTSWTDAIVRAGATTSAPIDPGQSAVPPLPGTEFVAIPTAAPTVTVEQRRSSPMGVIVGLVIAVLLVVLIVVLVNNGDSGDDSPTPTQAPATEAPAEGG